MKNKKQKRLLLCLCSAFILSTMSIGMVACKKPGKTDVDSSSSSSVVEGDQKSGVYYFQAQDKEVVLTLNNGTFTLAIGNELDSGSYVYGDDGFTLTFANGDSVAVADNDNVLTLVYKGGEYRLVSKTTYAVSFDVDGGSEVAAVNVLNGKTVSKPADPTKTGYEFIGWYEDKAYTTPFAFDATPISGNVTLYARFVEESDDEYVVNFVVDGASDVYAPVSTKGGKAFDLPVAEKEGATFLGWWMSDYQEAGKLTRQYNGETLTQNVTLYAVWASDAPAVSVTETGIEWSVGASAKQYLVQIKDAEGNVVNNDGKGETLSATTYKYDFSALAAGEYSVVVSVSGGKATTAYFKNKALDRVSSFTVAEPSLLVFNGVENAESYLISVVCGNEEHDHISFNNGKSTNYNFGNCAMKEGGIEFTVTAVAKGYVSSVSETFTYSRDLAAVTGLKVNEETDEIRWNKVANAASYVVSIAKDGEIVGEVNVGAATNYSLKNYTGELTVTVYAVAEGYNAPKTAQVVYNKTKLASPTNVRIDGSTVLWNAVEGAASYSVKIGDTAYEATGTSFTMTDEHFTANQEDYAISVRAVSSETGKSSSYSTAISVKYATMADTLEYQAGAVTWEHVITAARYGIKVNGGEMQYVEAGENSLNVTLTQAGENLIEVCYYDAKGIVSNTVGITVYAYEVDFEEAGGSSVKKVYKAIGDPLDLPSPEQAGYDFGGWYNVPGGANSNGTKFTNDSQIKGNTLLYAYWKSKSYNITFVVNENEGTAPEQSSVSVQYNESYKLPVAVSTNPTKTFGGWYSGNIAYTDPLGNAINGKVWDIAADTELKAKWIDIFAYTSYDGGQTYTISAGSGLSYVTEITIPVNYVDANGNTFPITTVGLFNGAEKLEIVRIPDTIEWIEVGSAGPNGAGAAFRKCDNLKYIEIYEVEGDHDRLWEDIDGVLIYNNPVTGKELKYIPYARTEAYEIPEGITSIPVNAFRNTLITQVTIPTSVTLIDEYAFYGCANLQHVIFKENETATTLKLGANAFYNCTSMQEITLPAYLSEIELSTFAGCSNLTAINVTEGENATYKSIDGVLCTGTEIFYAPLALNTGDEGRYEIPAGVKTIGANAFKGNKSIVTLVVPYFIESIGANAFANATQMRKIVFEGTAEMGANLEIGEQAFYGCYGLTYDGDEALVLPGNLKKLGANAFGNTYGLKYVRVESTTGLTFANGAFADANYGRTNLVKLYIGKDVEPMSISGVFGGNTLEEVIVHEENANYETVEGVLYDEDITIIMYYPMGRKADTYTLPSTVTSITAGVFKDNIYLETVNVPATVFSIEDEAFYNCKNLKAINFLAAETGMTEAESLTIGKSAFKNCDKITTITLPERTTTIGASAFEHSEALVSIVIPEGVTTIGARAFTDCKALTAINLPASLESIDSYPEDNTTSALTIIFEGVDALETITVASGNANYLVDGGILYQKTDGVVTDLLFAPTLYTGNKVTEDGVEHYVVTIPATVTRVADGAFRNNTGITKIVFEARESSTELTLGGGVFNGCTKLSVIELPEGLVSIGDRMFQNCASLKTIVIPSTVATIGSHAFMSCPDLEEVIFTPTAEGKTPVGLTFAGESIFYDSDKLSKIDIPTRTIKIGYAAFQGIGATEVTLPDTAEFGVNSSKYGSNFFRSTRLETVTFVSGVEKYLDADGVEQTTSKLSVLPLRAFGSCELLKSINLPEGITEIQAEVFKECKKLDNVVLPSTVATVGKEAFALTGMKSLTLNEGLTIIGDNAFAQNASLGSVTIPSTVTTISTSAFYRCAKLKTVDFAESSEALTISNYAFNYCFALESINIPARTTSIGISAFTYCNKLTSVTFEVDETTGKSNLSSIASGAFTGCPIAEFAFPETTGSLTVADGIFDGCKQLSTVTISSTVASLSGVFSGCYSIQEVVVNNNPGFVIPEAVPFLMDKDQKAIHYILGELPAGAYTIVDGVTTIGASTFAGQMNITSITIPASVTSIEEYAFNGCLNLKQVIFEGTSALASIGQYAFRDCKSLESITLPSSVTSIGNYAFYRCTGLRSVTITTDRSFDLIGTNIFNGCTLLSSVSLSDSVKTISDYMFANCKSLTAIDLHEGILTLGNYAFQNSGLISVTIPNSVKCLCGKTGSHTSCNITTSNDSCTFQGCANLVSISLPDTMTVIGGKAFQNCSQLSYISLPASLTRLQRYAFDNTGLTSVDFSKVTTTTTSFAFGQNVFSDNYSLTSVNLGNMVKLGQNMFQNCTALESIDLSKITSYAANAFQNCTSLKNVTLNSATTDFAATSLFSGCSALESIVLPGGLTTIGGSTFANCTKLKTVQYMGANGPVGEEGKVTLPETLTSFGNTVFMNSGIEYVTIPSGVTMLGAAPTASSGGSSGSIGGGIGGSIGGGTLKPLPGGGTITPGPGIINPGIGGGGSIAPGAGTTNSDVGIFESCANLKTVVFHDKVTTIGTNVFRLCPSLTTITGATGVTGVNIEAFRGCTSLRTIDLPAATTFGSSTKGVFQDCTSLTSFSFNDSVKEIPQYMFLGCTALTSVDMPESLTTIGASAFEKTGLMMVVIPESVATIGDKAFGGCFALEDILVSGSNVMFKAEEGLLYDRNNKLLMVPAARAGKVTIAEGATIGAYAFDGCTLITEIVLPEGIKEIADYAFAGMTSLTKIVLPESVEVIGAGAFQGCTSLSDLVLPQYVHTIKANAFNGCEALTTLELPASLTTLEKSTFAGCYIQTITLPENIIELPDNLFEGAATEVVNFLGELHTIGQSVFKASNVKQTGTDTVTLEDGTVLPAFTIPNTVTLMKYGAFESSGAEAVIIGESLKQTDVDDVATIGTCLFQFSAELKYVQLPANLITVNANWFNGCTSLKSIELPSTVRKINASAFENSGLETISLPEGLLEIGSSAFKGSQLRSIEFPSTLQVIGDQAFRGTKLVSVVIPNNVLKVGVAATNANSGNVSATGGVFEDCELLEEVTLPETLDIISGYMFNNCINLRTVNLPDGIRRIGNYAFANCTSLAGLVLPETVTDVWNNVFSGWTSTQRVYFAMSERMAVTGWTSGANWNANGGAKAVWDYQA